MDNNQSFQYTYSAERQQEIENIRKKYLPKEEDKMEQLRTLHHSATRKAKSASIAIGVIGALILGTGMSLCMTELGASLGQFAMVLGVLAGLIGLSRLYVGVHYPTDVIAGILMGIFLGYLAEYIVRFFEKKLKKA